MTDNKEQELQKLYESLTYEQLEHFLTVNGLFVCSCVTPMYIKEQKTDELYDSVFDFSSEELAELVEELKKKYEDTERYLVIPLKGDAINTRVVNVFGTYKAVANVGYGDGLILVNEEKEERALKLIQQQLKDGFNDSQLWDFDFSIAKSLLPKMLARFKDITHSHPMDLTEQEWDDILAKLIWYLDNIADEPGAPYKYESSKYKEDMEKCNELFAKYFRDLWD